MQKTTLPTPNCNLCKWRATRKKTEGFYIIEDYSCSGQGDKLTEICYNSEMCKKLYEQYEEKLPEERNDKK